MTPPPSRIVSVEPLSSTPIHTYVRRLIQEALLRTFADGVHKLPAPPLLQAGLDPETCAPSPATVCAHLLHEVLPVVVARIQDCRLLVSMTMVCRAWRSHCVVPVGG